MHFGHYISGFAHLGLLTGLFIGPVFQKDIDPIEYSNVSLISQQEFIDLTATNISPVVSEEPSTFKPAEENDDKLNLKFNAESSVLKSEGPEVVLDEPLEPVIKQPQIEIANTQKPHEISEYLQPPVSEKLDSLPNVNNEANKLNKRSTVLTPTNTPQPEINFSQSLESTVKTVDELDIAGDKKKASADNLELSLKPKSRPRYNPETNFEDKSEKQVIEANISNEIQSPAPQKSLSNPLTETETDNLQSAIQACWLRDPGSLTEDVKLTIFISLDRNGRVNPNSIKVIEISGGDDDAQRVAFRRAKIAIISCGKNGYKLPPNKYESWREIEVVFDPTI